jgi:uncharacterized protein YcfJ
MKQTLVFTVLGVAALGAGAQEVGRVISSTPVIQQVAVPRTYCNQPTYVAPPPTSGAGGLMGAIAGGALGSQIGSGSGTAAAVILGVAGGALLGDRIEQGGQQPTASQVCGTETTYENRAVGYNVTYEYAGRQFTTQMPYDPGATVQLQVTPVSQGAPASPTTIGTVVTAPPVQQQAAPVAVAPVYVQPAPIVYQSYPVYPAYPAYPAYPVYRPYWPVGVSLGFSFSNHRHGGHRHFRHR